MGKLNKAAKKRSYMEDYEKHPDAKRNYEGGLTFTPDLESELYIRVLGCLWHEPRFYETVPTEDNHGDEDGRPIGEAEAAIIKLASTLDPEYVLKLATYARNEMHLRTVPQVLLVTVANRQDLAGHPKPYVARYGPSIMARLDEVMEAVAYQLKVFGKPIPNALRNAICARLQRITEYEAIKYRRANAEVSLVDVINLVHPKPTSEYCRSILQWVMTGEVCETVVPQIASWVKLSQCTEFDDHARKLASVARPTWELLISKFGNRKEVWEAAEMPYTATLSNLCNLIQAGVDINPALQLITDPEAIARSKQYPFRLANVYNQLKDASWKDRGNINAYNRAMLAIEQAMETSIANLPRLPGRTLVLVDTSGSMWERISHRSVTHYMDIAIALGAIAHSICEKCKIVSFGTDYKFVNLYTTDTVKDKIEKISKHIDHGGTMAEKPIRHITNQCMEFDRIILLSDMQIFAADNMPKFVTRFQTYRRQINPDVRLVSVNLAGYNDLPVPQDQTMLLSGWSEQIFDLLAAWEKDPSNAVEHIKQYVDTRAG